MLSGTKLNQPPPPVVAQEVVKVPQKEPKSKTNPKKKVDPPKIDDNALETALVRSYYTKVQSRFSSNTSVPTNKFVQFQSILKSFDPTKETPVDLYRKIENVFGEEHKDIVEEFLLFLKPGQAAEVGRFMDHFMLVQMTGFIELLQSTLSRKPTVLRKVLRAITTGINSGSSEEMRKHVLPHLRSNPRLATMFKSLFPDERPPDSAYETGVDMIDEGFLTNDKGYDVWEFEEESDNKRKLDVKESLDTVKSKKAIMSALSDNYYLRRYYLENEDVPTQSMIKRKMTPKLAAVFFKLMDPKLKVLAGLEPPLAGGGSDWYVCPKTIFSKNKAVLKPLDHEYLTKLNHKAIVQFGRHALIVHRKVLDKEEKMKIIELDAVWRDTIALKRHRFYDESIVMQSRHNTEYIRLAFEQFTDLYRTSLNYLEKLIHEEFIKDIKNLKDYLEMKMMNRYKILLKSQAITISNSYTEKLIQDKKNAKTEFIERLETMRAEVAGKYHDLKLDKQVAVESLRRFLECQKLACQVYVALKEREECAYELQEMKHRHEKKLRHLTEDIVNFELNLEIQKDKRRQELNTIWLKKVAQVVKKFQMYVSYCLKMLPEYADFFINMEKLMLLQVDEALANPNAESIIAVEENRARTPVPQAKPFYLFCDTGYKAKLDQELCPKPNGTSSSAQLLPAVIINKRYMYAACDNFEQFTNKVKQYIRGYDPEIKDDLIYEHFVPVKYTLSQQLKEIKLESSLLQVLQQEMSNSDVGNDSACGVPYCFCASLQDDKKTIRTSQTAIGAGGISHPTSSNNKSLLCDKTKRENEKEPKIQSYVKYLEPKTCICVKTCKKRLVEHLPPYMRNKSKYETVELPNYETCSPTILKKLVENSRAKERRGSLLSVSSFKTRDMATQYSDEEFDALCTCFSHDSSDSNAKTSDRFNLDEMSPSYMTSKTSSFAIGRARSLKQLIEDAPELIEIFSKNK